MRTDTWARINKSVLNTRFLYFKNHIHFSTKTKEFNL